MRRVLVLVLLLGVVGCGNVTTTEPPAGVGLEVPPAPEEVVVRFGEHAVTAEVAADPETRQRGLMFRESLGEDAGMLFLFPAPRSGGFWMKNTLIPLSIAFLEASGEEYVVLAVLDMEPCEEDPCPSYDPGVVYEAALEVNLGWFGRAGVEVGSIARVEGTLPQVTS